MRAIANNTAPLDSCCNHTEDDGEEAWRKHSIGMDELIISCAVERMLALGAKAQVMDLFADLIREHRLDRFIGRIGAE